ncbi:MAG: hypothetical protein Q4G61_02805 [Tissierellia bacterium]|nr:hypothetical protein [Tissierellia bacterium]
MGERTRENAMTYLAFLPLSGTLISIFLSFFFVFKGAALTGDVLLYVLMPMAMHFLIYIIMRLILGKECRLKGTKLM